MAEILAEIYARNRMCNLRSPMRRALAQQYESEIKLKPAQLHFDGGR